jgi:thiol-disulfide isomerase/thioredoxin
MRIPILISAVFLSFRAASAQTSNGPTDVKAQKTYSEAVQALRIQRYFDALDKFKKANKQDGGHCSLCLTQVVSLASQVGDFKAADSASRDLIALAQTPAEAAKAHYQHGVLLLQQGSAKNKNDLFSEANEEFKTALSTDPKNTAWLYAQGLALARLKQDDSAKTSFQQVAELARAGSITRSRALRFAARPELARERMAPAFALTAAGGQRVSMDELEGKVVLLDFWATWCGPCREALPHMKRIAQKFAGQPLVILSISLDNDEQKWKAFVAQNEMTWLQYRDGGFEGPIAKLFDVRAIPHTFTIDSDGVLQEEKIGDASVEGKLKKLIVEARELQESRNPEALSSK